MNCTRCGSGNCRRSRRRLIDLALAAIGVWPWRCLDCKSRFYARRIPLRVLPYAHCPDCGNTQLLRIRRDRLDSGFIGLLAVWLGAKPLRCAGCRNNFASWRPLRKPKPLPDEHGHREETAAGARG